MVISSLKWLTGKSSSISEAERNYGALFIRSGIFSPGPSAFIYHNGDILFRIQGDDPLECEGALPNPSSATTRYVKYSLTGDTLSVVTPTKTCSNR